MKFQIYNSENSRQIKTGKPFIGVDFTCGVFRLTRNAAELIGLKNNDQVNIAFEPENEEWYIFKVKENGFICRLYGAGESLLFNCAKVARKIQDSMTYTKNTGHLIVGSEYIEEGKTKYFPLITGLLKND